MNYPNLNGFVCNDCLAKMDHERVVEERHRLLDRDYYEAQMMLDVLRELCPIEGWYKLKSIAHEFNIKVFDIDKQDNIHVSTVLNKLGFKKRSRKHRGSFMHVWVDPNLIPAVKS